MAREFLPAANSLAQQGVLRARPEARTRCVEPHIVRNSRYVDANLKRTEICRKIVNQVAERSAPTLAERVGIRFIIKTHVAETSSHATQRAVNFIGGFEFLL